MTSVRIKFEYTAKRNTTTMSQTRMPVEAAADGPDGAAPAVSSSAAAVSASASASAPRLSPMRILFLNASPHYKATCAHTSSPHIT